MKTSDTHILRLLGVTSFIALLSALPALAGNVTMTANDAQSATTSYNGAGKWSNSQAPSSANDYYTAQYFIRTPTDSGNTTWTFAGNSLTLQQPANGNARSFIVKGGANDTFVMNNLTNAYGGILENGGAGNVVATFTGNLWTIAGNSAVVGDQGSILIGYPLIGASGVILTNSGGNGSGITYNNDNSGYKGIFYLSTVNFGNGGGNTKVILNAANGAPGNPTTFTPNQFWIGAGCTLQDNLGLLFTNSNAGFLLNGPGTANISVSGTTLIGEPITDLTNGVSSICSLTVAGGGVLVLSNANNTYSGGTIISAGTLQMGVDNAIPGNTLPGDVTDNALLDLNGHIATINGLTGSGTVDNTGTGAATLTIGANGDGGTLTGSIQNSLGTLSLVKIGGGSETLSGGYTYSGSTTVAGGTLNLSTSGSVPSTPGNIIVSNAILSVDASGGNPLPANNLLLATNGTLSVAVSPYASGINVAGGITFQDNATNTFAFGTVTANPSVPAINVSGGISAPGTNVVINITATGLQVGTFTLIKYTGTPLASLANFQLSLPPGLAATLENNSGNDSIDLHITSIPSQLSWYGTAGGSWDLTTANWLNVVGGVPTIFQQYTNGSVVAGDSVLFDDTLTNDFINPQPTNIVLNSHFYAFPVVFNSTLPYSIAGTGGILGVTSLTVSNTGSLTLLTSNSFTGGVNLVGGTLIITNDSALGASSGKLTLNGGTLLMNGNGTNSRTIAMPASSTIGVGAGATVGLGGVISGASSLNTTNGGTLVLTAHETFTGDLFVHTGTTIIDSGGSFTNGNYNDVGQNGDDNGTLTLRGTGSLLTTSDFNLGDLDNSIGTLNIANSATLTANQFFVGSANAAGSTASGVVNQTGGTVTEVSTAVGAVAIGGRTSATGVGVYNMSGGVFTANAGIRVGGTGIGTLNQSGGRINAIGGINIARIAGSFGTNNLNGGVLSTYNIASSTASNAVFNFNGGTLQAAFNPGSPWFSTAVTANVLAGGAIIDSSNFNVTVAAPLLAGSANGGLTKLGSGTLTLTGANTYTGPTTNNAGTLILNSAVTNSGGLTVNGGVVQFNSNTSFQGPTTVNNGATLALTQVGSVPVTIKDLTLTGAASGSGAVLSLTPGAANNPAVAMLNCGTLTLNGTNTISLAAVNVGSFALVKYTGTLVGSGNCTNLTLPQGATGYVTNDAVDSILYAVVTSTGPGLVWTGTNGAAANLWDINTTTNWTVNAIPTSYHQIISPGDAVTFNDTGSGTVTLNATVAPASITISNNAKAYTFSGTGGISGPSSLLKVGTGTVILNLTNDTYAGNTVISNGTLQIVNNGVGSTISPSGNLVIGDGGTLSISATVPNPTTAVGEFTGNGQISYTGGFNSVLSFGGSADATWNGTIRDAGGGGLSLTKTGTGTWIVGGTNYLGNSDFFNAVSQNQFNGGTTIITNGGLMAIALTECWIAQGAGSTSTVVVANGTLAVSNDWLCVGRGDATANGTLIVDGGTVLKAGANNLVVGSTGATGTLIVNGGQVLNNSPLWLGEDSTGSGTLDLNGGLVQATVLQGNASPLVSVANFNGGTLQAVTNSTDFLQVVSMIISNGLVLDDGGYTISIASQGLQQGDSFNGGFVKTGAGTVYLDSACSYTGSTVVSNGLLAGIGSISGPVVVAPSGQLGAGDAGGNGSITINNNLTFQGGSFMRVNKTGGSLSEDQVNVSGNVVYGGVLTVGNLTSDGTALASGDTFQLFSVSGTKSGNFSGIAGSPGSGLHYTFDPSSGVLSVATGSGIASNPTNITFAVSSGSLSLSWPSDHLGWILQAQTNNLGAGLGSNWVDIGGSSSTTSYSVPIDPAAPSVFYRLRKP